MMDLEITQENTESLSEVLLCSFANEVAAELLSHPANEHCQSILQNCGLVITAPFDTRGMREKDEEVMTFSRAVGI